MATMTIRCDEADKKRASEIANYYGLDLSSVTRAFWKEMIRTNSIPLSFGNYEPNMESLKAINETKKLIENHVPGKEYKNGEDVLNEILGFKKESET